LEKKKAKIGKQKRSPQTGWSGGSDLGKREVKHEKGKKSTSAKKKKSVLGKGKPQFTRERGVNWEGKTA